jgi:hypothetical protein
MVENLKVGDWVFKEYELYLVDRIQGDVVTLKNGYIECGTSIKWKDSLYPLTLKNKVISTKYEQLQNTIMEKYPSLDYPKVSNILYDLWVKELDGEIDWYLADKKIAKLMQKLEEVSEAEFDGIKLFK